MAKCVNKVTLIGYLADKPDIRLDQKGKQVAVVKLVTSYEWIDKKTGNEIVAADLHKLILFSRNAILAGAYLKKGSKIYIEGKIKNNTYESEGRPVKTSEIHVSEMQMLDQPPQKKSDLSASEDSL